MKFSYPKKRCFGNITNFQTIVNQSWYKWGNYKVQIDLVSTWQIPRVKKVFVHGIVKEELLGVQKLQLLQSITILYFHVQNALPTM